MESPIKPEKVYYIDGKLFAVKDSMNIKMQSCADDKQVYGWTLEAKFKHSGWLSWNNRIYVSVNSAIEAALKIGNHYEWRVLPIYRMNKLEWREYKIDEMLLPENNNKYVPEIKAWKVIEDYERITHNNIKVKVKKGTIFIKLENGVVVKAATTSEPTEYNKKHILENYLIPNGKVEEIDIKKEKWIFPHLCKELKNKIKNEKNS